MKVLDRGCLGPYAEAIDGGHFFPAGEVYDRGRNAEEATVVHVHYVQREAHGHSGVDGVAAFLQDFQAGHGGAGVAGGNHAVDALHERAVTG